MYSIYSKGDEPLLKLFEQVKDPAKILCVAIDYAKAKHVILFCNGVGEVLKHSFAVENSAAGLEQLLAQIQATCHHRGILPKHVLCGGEDSPAYAANFTAALSQKKFLVVRVSASEAKTQRQNFQASNDNLDLYGMVACLITRRGRLLAIQNQEYAQLRILVRERDYLVRCQTALTNRFYPHVDQLFPGFLQPASAVVTPFGPACLWLLEHDFSAPQIARRASQRLVQGLKKHRVPEPDKAVEELQELARQALPPRAQTLGPCQISLAQLVPLRRGLQDAVQNLDRHIGRTLARTPAAVLTSIPGIGVTLAAGLGAEVGVLARLPSLDSLCSYAGIVPCTTQSGGPDQPPVTGHKSRQVNKRLKCCLMLGGEHMAAIQDSQAQRLRQRAEEKKQHACALLAKHLAGLARSLLQRQTIYLPPELYDPSSAPYDRAQYYQTLWPKWLEKWKTSGADLHEVFAATTPLGQWRTMVCQVHKLSLPLPGSAQQIHLCSQAKHTASA